MTREHPRGNSGNLGAPHRRSLVVVDQPACFILCDPATWYAAALSSRGVVLRSADRNLTATQVIRLAGIFSTEPATLRRLTFSNVAPRFPTPDCSQTATVLLSLPSE